jgi:hypothetical protein
MAKMQTIKAGLGRLAMKAGFTGLGLKLLEPAPLTEAEIEALNQDLADEVDADIEASLYEEAGPNVSIRLLN